MVGRGFCYLEQSGLHICMSVLLPKYVLLCRRMGPVVFMNPDQESFCTKDHCNQMAISIYNSVSLLKDILVIGLIDRNWSWGQGGCIMGPYLCCLYPFSCESYTVLASSFIHSHTPLIYITQTNQCFWSFLLLPFVSLESNLFSLCFVCDRYTYIHHT